MFCIGVRDSEGSLPRMNSALKALLMDMRSSGGREFTVSITRDEMTNGVAIRKSILRLRHKFNPRHGQLHGSAILKNVNTGSHANSL